MVQIFGTSYSVPVESQLEGISLTDIANARVEKPRDIEHFSRSDVLRYFGVRDSVYTEEDHARLISDMIYSPICGSWKLPFLYNPQSISSDFITVDDLSDRTRCELQIAEKIEDGRMFNQQQQERQRRNSALVAQDGAYIFQQYTLRYDDIGLTHRPSDTAIKFLETFLRDVSDDRKQAVRNFVMQSGCLDPVMLDFLPEALVESGLACYQKVIDQNWRDDFDSDRNKANTNTYVGRTLRAMAFLAKHADSFSGSLQKVLIIGAGREVVPPGFSVALPPQIQEPFAVMDTVMGHYEASLDHLSVDVFDINPVIIRDLNVAKSNAVHGVPYSLALHWALFAAQKQYSFGEDLPLFSREPRTERKGGGDLKYTLFWEKMAVKPEVLDHIYPKMGDISVNAVGNNGPYDLIVMLHVYHYLNTVERLMAYDNMANALRPGGFLLTDMGGEELRPHSVCVALDGPELQKIASSDDISGTLFLLQR